MIEGAERRFKATLVPLTYIYTHIHLFPAIYNCGASPLPDPADFLRSDLGRNGCPDKSNEDDRAKYDGNLLRIEKNSDHLAEWESLVFWSFRLGELIHFTL